MLLVPFTVLLAIYITAHGHLTPGGGFQGGVIAASALLLIYIGGEYVALRRVRPLSLVEVSEASGAAAFVLIGVGGIIFAGAFLENFLPLRTPGSLVSAGTIPLLSFAVGKNAAQPANTMVGNTSAGAAACPSRRTCPTTPCCTAT